jgi:EmrB/QacA subfamily drug resistance transporter
MSPLSPSPQSTAQQEQVAAAPATADPVLTQPLPAPAPKDLRKWFATVGIGIGVFIFALDVYIVNLALPVMVTVLETNFATIQWVVLSYLLAIAISVLTIAKLGDLFSKKQLYIGGLLLFTVSSLLCGLAPNVGWLIGGRFLQGIGAAFLSGLGTAILVEVFPKEQRGLGLGIRAAIYGFGITAGPTVGGFLLALGGWQLIFLINVPIGIIGCLIVAWLVPPSRINAVPSKFDGLGTVVLTLTLACFTLAITLWQQQAQALVTLPAATVPGLLVTAFIGLVSFIATQIVVPFPLIDLQMFRALPFTLGLVLRFIGNFVIAGVLLVLPFFLEVGQKYSADKAGLLLAVSPLIIVLTAPLAGILADRFGAGFVSLIGLGLMAGGCGLMTCFTIEATPTEFMLAVIPYGLGVGMFQSPNNSVIMGAVAANRLGLASGLLSLARILGQAVGVPLIAALLASMTLTHSVGNIPRDVVEANPAALLFGVRYSFSAVAILLSVTLLVATPITWWHSRKQDI